VKSVNSNLRFSAGDHENPCVTTAGKINGTDSKVASSDENQMFSRVAKKRLIASTQRR
jgi:hypothetical protein